MHIKKHSWQVKLFLLESNWERCRSARPRWLARQFLVLLSDTSIMDSSSSTIHFRFLEVKSGVFSFCDFLSSFLCSPFHFFCRSKREDKAAAMAIHSSPLICPDPAFRKVNLFVSASLDPSMNACLLWFWRALFVSVLLGGVNGSL